MDTTAMKPLHRAFTLVEMMVVVALVSILVSIALPALHHAKGDTVLVSAKARAKTLNEARDRAILKGLGGYETRAQWDAAFGTNGAAAAEFLITNNLVLVRLTN